MNDQTLIPIPALTLIKLTPDATDIARWARSKGIAAFEDDLGYAAHAAAKAVFGDLAPQPFSMRMKDGRMELLGYTAASVAALSRVAALQTHDDLAARALDVDAMVVKAMPSDWAAGERYSFECRVAPTRRTRQLREGRYLEVDVAVPQGGPQVPIDRDTAYTEWLGTELGRFGAAKLTGYAPFAFKLTATARRSQAEKSRDRQTARGLVPDLVARGELEVTDAAGFSALLARGLGRHRAFGFGCLLLAPRGVLYTPSLATPQLAAVQP